MKGRLLVLVALVVAAVGGEAALAADSDGTAAAVKTFSVSRVVDGDTITLKGGTRVRLVQIDAPEKAGECNGTDSTTVLRRLLPVGTQVRLVADPGLDKVDRFGRLLRYVFKRATNVNLELVKRGAATVWFFEADRGRYATKLAQAAQNARAAGKGMWGRCDVVWDPDEAATTFAAGTGGELNTTACADGIDNDGDGKLDYPLDPSCSRASDTDESDPPPACSDGIDNDSDGQIDYPADVGCGSSADTDERNNQCADGTDNDGDGKIDYPSDTGCASAGDDQETTTAYQCDDGQDNDGDGKTDYPDDPDCSEPTDTSEGSSAPPPNNCDPSYPGVCIPPPPPDLDCGDISYTNFTVLPPDPHNFDGDHDGIGCET
jgi:endonuclease YncB( thermonuclease family)